MRNAGAGFNERVCEVPVVAHISECFHDLLATVFIFFGNGAEQFVGPHWNLRTECFLIYVHCLLYRRTCRRNNNCETKRTICYAPLEFNLHILAILGNGAALSHTLDYCTYERGVNGISTVLCDKTPTKHLSIGMWSSISADLDSERGLFRTLNRNNSHFAFNSLWISCLFLRWHLYLYYNSFAAIDWSNKV